MRGSLASGRVITFLLGEGLWPGTPGPLPLLVDFVDGAPEELLSLVSLRECAVIEAGLGRSSSALRTTGDS